MDVNDLTSNNKTTNNSEFIMTNLSSNMNNQCSLNKQK